MFNQEFLNRLGQLNACQTPDQVAELLRKDGIKGTDGDNACIECAIARDLQRFEPKVEVGLRYVYLPVKNREDITKDLSTVVSQFIQKWERGQFPDLVNPKKD